QGAFTITAVKDIQIIQELHQAIQATLNQPNEAAAWEQYKIDAKAILKEHGKRGVRIESLIVSFRTARSNAYSEGIWAKAKGLGAKLYGLLYNARDDNDTRVNHNAADGVLLPLNHIFWKSWKPANGFNERCWLSIVTKEMASAQGLRFTPDKDLPTARGLKPDQGFGA
ncbi:MAG: hypothetical protein GY788_01600, partial [bacterium]|nr:hypothetical protein [bacterium]